MSNWPPLQINGARVRAGYATITVPKDSQIASTVEVTMPAFDRGPAGFLNLLGSLQRGEGIEVLFSRAVPSPPTKEPARMCGGKFADPEAYMGKISCIDMRATPGDRIDLDITFEMAYILSKRAYNPEDHIGGHVMTWNELNMDTGDVFGQVNSVQVRMTRGMTTGYFTLGGYTAFEPEGPAYDLDEYGARIWIGNTFIKH